MLAKATAVLAIVGSASAYVPMQVSHPSLENAVLLVQTEPRRTPLEQSGACTGAKNGRRSSGFSSEVSTLVLGAMGAAAVLSATTFQPGISQLRPSSVFDSSSLREAKFSIFCIRMDLSIDAWLAAFGREQMSLSANRRQVIAGVGAAAIIAPLAANAKNGDLRAPYVEIFDARGCESPQAQYTVSVQSVTS
jgi:hypothetical protein